MIWGEVTLPEERGTAVVKALLEVRILRLVRRSIELTFLQLSAATPAASMARIGAMMKDFIFRLGLVILD